ncbi:MULTISPECIES: SpoIIIAH-like family protein [unclassified Bacillus (in: firmicutes)]|uniref:SpoIIIAH-like family protein n=1 Tax=unclassified Bacillus (in: firmicutes) TaxID=185979 RepID=UPI0008E19B6B|nr:MULTISPECIES: SpoIIIAH-like family protein [unclassified Bacillus (in: firmicutes)]SFA96738.1 stage III sporulation protein AH [Bacillus sp. UNCCL13]SFQ80003.1 stage III sporulation protein AH [Bacillus sp. cl95]
MLLKKQTVWLLTMLSLVVVLSVYYITSPEQKGQDFAAIQDKVEEKGKKDGAVTESEDGKTVISGISSDEAFETLRLQLEDQRNAQKEELEEVLASTDLPTDKRNDAYEQMEKLNDVANTEQILETTIKTMGYDDALVRVDGEHIKVTVKSKKKHSPTAANDIIQLVRTEIGEMRTVAVEFKPAK